MDQAIRNKLRNIVTQCRKLLEEATAQALQGRFGMYAARKKGEVQVEEESRMAHLAEEDRACRQDLLDHLEHIQAIGYKSSEALEQLIREIAFTHLNRLCAYKMMEARGLIREAVSRGLKSQYFFFYLSDHPEDEKLHNGGRQEAAYRNFLDWLGGTLSQEIGVLFNPNDPANRIYPPQRVLDEVLELINDGELSGIWSQDETIGWVYQYFTPKELRDKARKESQAPRNSYELAFRNQFFTPRYVVEFLTDNTLGRIWYEMRKGKTVLKDRCRYLVRRPNEIFLKEGEVAPVGSMQKAVGSEELNQEELLKQPVYIEHRPKKDPRDFKVLDPACGSGHFLLYAFDLLEKIYQEWNEEVAAASRRCEDQSRDGSATAFIGYFSPDESVTNLTGDLPHWRQDNVTYFVTFRLADSLPQEKLSQWQSEKEQWLKNHPEPHNKDVLNEFYRLFPERLQHWLDAGYGSCLMRDPAIRGAVEQALLHFDGQRYRIHEYVVSINHVHVLVTPLPDYDLSSILHSWKSFTSHIINKRLGKTGENWQKESFDHIVRHAEAMQKFSKYIQKHPSWRPVVPARVVEAAARRCEDQSRDGSATSSSTIPPNMIPKLIIEKNLHGIDIDPRAVQIAALALWLRAQKAWKNLGIKPGDYPRITKSNIVCAEPMPGETDLLKEFTATLHPKVLGQLVEAVFEKMKLAGEAGSLLKIEEEIREAASTAKKEYQEELRRRKEQAGYLPGMGPPRERTLFDFSDMTDSEFLDRAEEEIVAALRQYAEKTANGKAFRRRLFAEDAARGFAFVDVCRKKFDVVLMNPPFGASSVPAKDYLVKEYPSSKTDIYASFVEQGVNLLLPNGTLGAITNRTGFFLSSLNTWRTQLFLEKTYLTCFSDLGHGVLDTAMVETAAYTAVKQNSKLLTTFVRVIDDPPDTKGLALATALSTGCELQNVYFLPASCFTELPGSPFAYWVDAAIRSLFKSCDCLETRGFKTCQGLITADDSRFLRLDWERPGRRVKSAADVYGVDRWASFAKGGDFSPFYSPLYMIADCDKGFKPLIDNANAKYPYLKGGAQKMLHAVPELFFCPGLNYTRRTTSEFSVRALPAGCVFSDKGPAILPSRDNERELLSLLGIVNSAAFRGLLALSMGAADAAARSYETGIVSKVPLPKVKGAERRTIEMLTWEAWDIQRFRNSWDETSTFFVAPWLLIALRNGKTGPSLHILAKKIEEKLSQKAVRLSEVTKEIDVIVWSAYGLGLSSQRRLETAITKDDSLVDDEGDDDGEEYSKRSLMDLRGHVIDVVQFAVGGNYGRWDIRFSTGERQPPRLPDPFDPLPVCPPGMLQGQDGMPAKPEDVPLDYPIRIDWDGILVDDPGHEDDIVRRIRGVLEVIWKDRAEAIEKEACDILGVRELRDYFRKPGNGGFWMDHVKRYSKSRRKAPIYWYLRSAKGNYGLWLYYHRLDKDILFKALLNYVEPKIRLEEDRLNSLRARKEKTGSSGREAKQIEKDMDRQEQFVSELRDFADNLRRAANLHIEPDLNDGVVLHIAPLWELAPWKEAKQYWDELVEGRYEWSSIGKQLREKGIVKE